MRGSDKELPVRSQNRRQNAGPCFRQLFAGQAAGPPHSAGVQGSLFNGADNPREDEGLGNRDTPATKLEASPGKRFEQKASEEEEREGGTTCGCHLVAFN